MNVWIVMCTQSAENRAMYEGFPVGIYSTKEKAEAVMEECKNHDNNKGWSFWITIRDVDDWDFDAQE